MPPRGASKAFEHMLHVVKGSNEGLALTFTGKQSPFLEFLSFKKENAIVIKMEENYEAVCTYFQSLNRHQNQHQIFQTSELFLKAFEFRFHSNTFFFISSPANPSERKTYISEMLQLDGEG